ncbi:ABC transporter permease [Planctomyces sp. SH-PL62]|uniref:ABC transporter permease n=1 Tax=Planctomyces sp. SH-PL62 TaxID=1636152 RepID=UPI00078E276A|nr:ABC transporter permease [Planctomyces sp. SH-PL62]AMV39588.1 Inner membrane transport permease YhhJ [Planctomyces sp. SH-PL62]
MESLANIFWLGVKELRSLRSDKVLVLFVIYAFTASIYTQARGTSSEVYNASIGFVDEDGSALSRKLFQAFYPPRFQKPVLIRSDEVDEAMDSGRLMFVVEIPPRYEQDLRAGRQAEVLVVVDATAMLQASIGASYIQNIISGQVAEFLSRSDPNFRYPSRLVVRKAFNPNGDTSWFNSIVAMINQVTLLTTVLTGAALIREREHGTIEHLLVMPLTAFEIAAAKIWSNALVILAAVWASLLIVIRGVLQVPIAGSPWLFLGGVILYLFFATALGVFLGTVARTMAQFALLIILILIVLQLLSGGSTPVESQPEALQRITYLLPSRHFVAFSQSIIYRGAGIGAVWPDFLVVTLVGAGFLAFSLQRFRRSIAVSR